MNYNTTTFNLAKNNINSQDPRKQSETALFWQPIIQIEQLKKIQLRRKETLLRNKLQKHLI